MFDWRDTLDSLNSGGSYLAVDLLLLAVLVLPALGWVYEHRLFTIDISPWRFLGLFLLVELLYYGFHRASHRIRWFWCAHVVHHGSEHMNFTTAMRQSWLYPVAGNWLFYLPMVWIGFEPRWVLFALSCNLAYQFFVHTQWVGKLHPLVEFFFNTPSHHRAHHGIGGIDNLRLGLLFQTNIVGGVIDHGFHIVFLSPGRCRQHSCLQ